MERRAAAPVAALAHYPIYRVTATSTKTYPIYLSRCTRRVLDSCHCHSYIPPHLVHGGTFREGTFESGTRAVPARGVTTRARAAPGIIHAGTTAGAGGAVPGLGQVKGG